MYEEKSWLATPFEPKKIVIYESRLDDADGNAEGGLSWINSRFFVNSLNIEFRISRNSTPLNSEHM